MEQIVYLGRISVYMSTYWVELVFILGHKENVVKYYKTLCERTFEKSSKKLNPFPVGTFVSYHNGDLWANKLFIGKPTSTTYCIWDGCQLKVYSIEGTSSDH